MYSHKAEYKAEDSSPVIHKKKTQEMHKAFLQYRESFFGNPEKENAQ